MCLEKIEKNRDTLKIFNSSQSNLKVYMQLQLLISCPVFVECIILKLWVFIFSYKISRSFASIFNGLECKNLNKILKA